MSESTPDRDPADTDQQTSGGSGDGAPDEGLISDEQLPEDLRPDENPLAADPDEQPESSTDQT